VPRIDEWMRRVTWAPARRGRKSVGNGRWRVRLGCRKAIGFRRRWRRLLSRRRHCRRRRRGLSTIRAWASVPQSQRRSGRARPSPGRRVQQCTNWGCGVPCRRSVPVTPRCAPQCCVVRPTDNDVARCSRCLAPQGSRPARWRTVSAGQHPHVGVVTLTWGNGAPEVAFGDAACRGECRATVSFTKGFGSDRVNGAGVPQAGLTGAVHHGAKRSPGAGQGVYGKQRGVLVGPVRRAWRVLSQRLRPRHPSGDSTMPVPDPRRSPTAAGRAQVPRGKLRLLLPGHRALGPCGPTARQASCPELSCPCARCGGGQRKRPAHRAHPTRSAGQCPPVQGLA